MSGLLLRRGYRKNDAPAMIAERFAELARVRAGRKWKPHTARADVC
jgi:hypothetical protein